MTLNQFNISREINLQVYFSETKLFKKDYSVVSWVSSSSMICMYFCPLFYQRLCFWNHLDDTPFHFYYYSKAEFIIYKLKLMRRITQRETLQIAKEFDLQDTRHFGKLTLNDILNMEAEWIKYGFPNGNKRWWLSGYCSSNSLAKASPPCTAMWEFTIILHQRYG